jgi:hypothetical protein
MTDAVYHRICLLLAATVLLLYAISSDGTLSVDPLTRWEVAESIVRDGDVALAYGARHTVEQDGRYYSVFFPGQTIVFLPVAALGVWVSKAGLDEDMASYAARFGACVFMISSFGALSFLGHLLALRQLGVRRRIAIGSGLVLAIGTPLWVWAGSGSEETSLATLAIWSAWAMLDARRIAREAPAADRDAAGARRAAARFASRMGLAGALLAFGLIFRSTFAAVALGGAVLGLPALWTHRRLLALAAPRVALWTIATLAIVALVPLYNWMRFDDPFDSGYDRYYEQIGGLFSTSLWTGLAGHLFSPGKSVFLYVPWLVLLPIALLAPAVWRRLGALAWALVVIIAGHLIVYSLHTYWSGAFGWGVRFHVSIMPLLLLPVGVWLDQIQLPPMRKGLLVALAAFSIAIQAAGNALNFGLEQRQHPEHYRGYKNLIPAEAAWTWSGSPFRLRFVNIWDKLHGRALLPLAGADDPQEITTVWDIFPMRASVAMDRPAVVRALWALWILLALGAAACAAAAARRWRRGAAATTNPRAAPG